MVEAGEWIASFLEIIKWGHFHRILSWERHSRVDRMRARIENREPKKVRSSAREKKSQTFSFGSHTLKSNGGGDSTSAPSAAEYGDVADVAGSAGKARATERSGIEF